MCRKHLLCLSPTPALSSRKKLKEKNIFSHFKEMYFTSVELYKDVFCFINQNKMCFRIILFIRRQFIVGDKSSIRALCENNKQYVVFGKYNPLLSVGIIAKSV